MGDCTVARGIRGNERAWAGKPHPPAPSPSLERGGKIQKHISNSPFSGLGVTFRRILRHGDLSAIVAGEGGRGDEASEIHPFQPVTSFMSAMNTRRVPAMKALKVT